MHRVGKKHPLASEWLQKRGNTQKVRQKERGVWVHKKISFLLTFLFMLGFILTGGFLFAKNTEQNNLQEVKHFSHGYTSINTGQKNPDASNVTLPNNKRVKKQTWYKNQVVVLMYHHVTDDTDQRYVISPEQFAAHMAFLYENDLHPITLTEFLQFVDTGVMTTENAVLITFDDGYESYYTEAFPILKQYGFPSVNFLIAGRLRDTIERKRENMTTPLSFQQVKEMLSSGLVEVGSHTYSLHEQETKNEWGELGPETAPVYLGELHRLEEEQEYRDRLYVDFIMSRVGLSDLVKKPIEAISFPFGFTNDMVTQTAQQAGYKYAFNSFPDVVKPGVHPYEIPRFGVGEREVDVTRLQQLFTKAKNEF